LSPDPRVLLQAESEVCAGKEVYVEHQDKVSPSEKPRDVPPSVELPVEGVNDQVHIDEA
jgi:hypothetical protein